MALVRCFSPPTLFLYNHKAGLEMDSSNIAIRNELVKRAASMHLQSSMIVSAPDTNWFKSFCLKAKHQAIDSLRPVNRILTFS
ncbi:unnamed protein product [Brassica oleracea var. botrytis]|uniref:Uncharacterized protein n=2 Tax=Brassica TaxID=3705 RepID=A0A0D3A432_BRAOL|nr:unnamed protein product [Brassica napus]CDY60878.1 BnaC01g40860D [Brassica napus]